MGLELQSDNDLVKIRCKLARLDGGLFFARELAGVPL